LRHLALTSPKVKAISNGNEPLKVIYVPGRLINIVL
jgi:leucyl-tRNA synthetase